MRRSWLAAAAILLGAMAGALAQTDFPNKPVTIVVPLAAGGPSDAVTRILAEELTKIWKQQVVIENKAGGGTIIGSTAVAKAKPDGYTMLVVSGSFVIGSVVNPNLPFDAQKDFAGVSVFVEGPQAIVAHPAFPANTLPELIEEARRRGDRPVTFAGAGTNSTGHMLGELIQRKTGVKLKHIAYTGEAGAVPDLLAGRIDFQFATWANVRSYVETGKLKLISVVNRERLAEAPNTPTINETLPGLGPVFGAFNAIILPAAVPAAVKAKIAEGIKTAAATKSYQERILAVGSYPRSTTPEETDAYLKNMYDTWSDVAKASNLRVD